LLEGSLITHCVRGVVGKYKITIRKIMSTELLRRYNRSLLSLPQRRKKSTVVEKENGEKESELGNRRLSWAMKAGGIGKSVHHVQACITW